MKTRQTSKKKQKLIDEKNNSPLVVGEVISVLESAVVMYKDNSKKSINCTISSLDNDEIEVFEGYEKDKNRHTVQKKISKSDITSRNLLNVGANPFDESFDHIRSVAFTLDSILFAVGALGDGDKKYDIKGVSIKKADWNPFIYDKNGKKQFYQRGFVWSVDDKRLLIESIYQNIDCGKILVRKKSFDELEALVKKGEKELAFNDIVDGKQRLNAVTCFIKGEFADLQGNYFGDLSDVAQRKLTGHQLFSYAEMPENTKDQDVIKQFLKLNFSGVPQSKEHIEFVKSLQK